MWQRARKLIIVCLMQEMDAGEEPDVDGIPTYSDETVDTQVNN